MQTLPFARPDIGPDEVAAVTECLTSGWLTTGAKTKEFESAFASKVGARHAIAVNSATMAALIILDALGVGPGTEVIVPAYTFSGPAMMAHRLGAKVVLADCRQGSYQVCVDSVANKITRQTRVVMPTHFAGAACNLETLRDLCWAHRGRVALVDDAAHAFPASIPGGPMIGSGTVSRATFFSFYATKCLTTGEGGMITTNDDLFAERMRRLALHGFSRQVFDRYTNLNTGWKYDIAAPGWKANLTDMASAMGLVQLRRSAEMLDRRLRIALAYREAFSRPSPGLQLVSLPPMIVGHAWHLFPIRVQYRNEFITRMAEKGVQCSVHFIPLNLHSYWQEALGVDAETCPEAVRMYQNSVSLPIYSSMTNDDVQRVIAAVLSAARA